MYPPSAEGATVTVRGQLRGFEITTANWIVVEGATRDGAAFRFREVQIDGNELEADSKEAQKEAQKEATS